MKRQARKSVKERLAACPPEYFAQVGRRAEALLRGTTLWKNAKSIFCYYGVGREPSTVPLLSAALGEGKAVYLPRVLPGASGQMALVQISGLTGLQKSAYGLLEPSSGKEARSDEIDLAIVPCVAVTLDGARLGHGGGYYDRFLRCFEGVSVVLCPHRAVLDALPFGEMDERVDYVLSEQGLYKTGA